jgi:biopolymer transport protein ExbB
MQIRFERWMIVDARMQACAATLLVGMPAIARAATAAPVAAAPAALAGSLLPTDFSLSSMVSNSDIVVQVVLAGLMVASIVTWTILLAKGFSFLVAQRCVKQAVADAENERTLASLQTRLTGETTDHVLLAMVTAAAREMQLSAGQDAGGINERVASRLHRLEASAGRKMARGIGPLATIGATAPFVGLFGTVWGIMNSFISISQAHATNLAVVAPGIAEALLATATGLVVAIPSVVIYNVFARGIGGYRATLADLSAAMLRLVSRELDRRHGISAVVE